MPIVSRTLLAGQSETWFFTGSGFSIVSASGLLSRIEFLRQQKTVEDLVGSFGEGFYFQTPSGSIFDGVRITAQTSGTYSVFIGHGVAGIIETDNAKPVTVTNSEIAVDVQNAILNTEIQNSALDVDIVAQTVDLTVQRHGRTNFAVGGNIVNNTEIVETASYNYGNGSVISVIGKCELYIASGSTQGYCLRCDLLRDSTVIFTQYLTGIVEKVESPKQFIIECEDSGDGSAHNYGLKVSEQSYGSATCPSSGRNPTYWRNAFIGAVK